MKTNWPTREEVAQRAHEIWKARGSPSGHDMEIWLEAERQLLAASSVTDATSTAQPKDKAGSHEGVEGTTSPPDPMEVAAKSAQQKNEARAPKLPTKKSAPKTAPPGSGKPLWSKPHSS